MEKHAAFWLIFLFLLIPAGSSSSEEITAQDLIYLTENYPPHNFILDGQLRGVSVEILQLMWKELDLPDKTAEIKLVPWARGMFEIKRKNNIVLFGMGYSPERAEQFHWVGPYYSHTLGLIGKKSAHYKIKTIKDVIPLLVGAVRDDAGQSQILKIGLPKSSLELSNNQESLFLKLQRDRLDLICFTDDAANRGMKKLGLDPDDYEMVYKLNIFKSGFGFSRQVPQHIIDSFQLALENLVKNGSVKKILKKYQLE